MIPPRTIREGITHEFMIDIEMKYSERNVLFCYQAMQVYTSPNQLFPVTNEQKKA